MQWGALFPSPANESEEWSDVDHVRGLRAHLDGPTRIGSRLVSPAWAFRRIDHEHVHRRLPRLEAQSVLRTNQYSFLGRGLKLRDVDDDAVWFWVLVSGHQLTALG